MNFQYRCSTTTWCGVTDGQFNGPFFLEEQLTGAVYAGFLEHKPPGLSEDMPLEMWAQMHSLHDERPPHIS